MQSTTFKSTTFKSITVKSLKNLSEFLRERRDERGLTQKSMYLRIGMPQQQYQKVEAGNDVRMSTLLRVADGLGLDILLVPKELRVKGEVFSALDSEPQFESVAKDYFSALEDDNHE